MSRFGYEDDISLLFPPFAVIGLEELEPDQFALGPGNRLGRDRGKSGDFGEPFLRFVQDRQGALGVFLGGLRMNLGEILLLIYLIILKRRINLKFIIYFI